jgi:hypothetical protein
MYSLYKNEYRIFKLVETIRKGVKYKEEKYRKGTNLGYNIYIHGSATRKLSV